MTYLALRWRALAAQDEAHWPSLKPKSRTLSLST
jgi:hypothetical protein